MKTARPESAYAWMRLAATVLLSTLGGVGMWSVVVALPAVQVDFGVDRAAASLPYTLTMIGVAAGGVVMGRLGDRFGILAPVLTGIAALSVGYVMAGNAATLWQFALAQGIAIGGLGASATFGPLLADISHWFTRRRGTAVAICAAGNYLAGTVWPPVIQHFIEQIGWRTTHIGIGLVLAATMLPLVLMLRRKPDAGTAPSAAAVAPASLGLPAPVLQGLLLFLGMACCVAMAMPQVHIVAYCGDLGYGVARGAQMLSLMLGFGIVSRLASGVIADRIGGLGTLLLGSTLQAATLSLYLAFDGLASLYVVSALFGLSQGGIVPSYAIIVREYFPAREAGYRVGLTLMATLVGMALGGWMSGVIFDLTGSYRAAFLNGLAWNTAHMALAFWLLRRRSPAEPRLSPA